MASLLRSAQEIIMPTKEKDTSVPAGGSTTTTTTGSTTTTGGLLGLLKKTTGIGATQQDETSQLSPPQSETTSPTLLPTDKAGKSSSSNIPAPIATNTQALKPLSPPLSHPSSPTSPIRSISPPSPSLPARQFPVTGSPARVTTASSSQIFERNVQEAHVGGAAAAGASATKIPAHIATENHIPAVLEASSIAITDESIDPENVEIAVLNTHQPLSSQASSSLHAPPHHHHHLGADASESSTLPPSTSHSTNSFTDKRRLSFISFSDIVQAEQADLLDSTILSPSPNSNVNPGLGATSVIDQVGISGITETLLVRRSPSPRRGAGFGTSSPPRTSAGLLPTEGLVVETMGQALRKTGSGDLGRGL